MPAAAGMTKLHIPKTSDPNCPLDYYQVKPEDGIGR